MHHPHLICKKHLGRGSSKYSGRLCGTLAVPGTDQGELCWCQPPGVYVERRCCSVPRDSENYVSILDADLQTLAVFTLS